MTWDRCMWLSWATQACTAIKVNQVSKLSMRKVALDWKLVGHTTDTHLQSQMI